MIIICHGAFERMILGITTHHPVLEHLEGGSLSTWGWYLGTRKSLREYVSSSLSLSLSINLHRVPG